MKQHYNLIAVGGGPAGLGAVIEAARFGASCLLIDENARPGGQLFKQIHKFFGSGEHFAGVRGFEIGKKLLDEARSLNVETMLSTTVWGIFDGPTVTARDDRGAPLSVTGGAVVLATGARENFLSFPGNALPGVITAGAAQTMTNVYGVLPGRRIVVVGSGNVGLIVSYQLRQAGAQVVAVVEAAPRVGGYAVHAAKLRRAGIPILLRSTVREALGDGVLQKVIVCAVDDAYRPVAGTERSIEADTLCIAAGLSPRGEIASLCGCAMHAAPRLGGMVPVHGAAMQTSVPGVFVAGDLSGVEEASTALEEGRLAGVSALLSQDGFDRGALETRRDEIARRLANLRQGPLGERIRAEKEKLYEAYGRMVRA